MALRSRTISARRASTAESGAGIFTDMLLPGSIFPDLYSAWRERFNVAIFQMLADRRRQESEPVFERTFSRRLDTIEQPLHQPLSAREKPPEESQQVLSLEKALDLIQGRFREARIVTHGGGELAGVELRIAVTLKHAPDVKIAREHRHPRDHVAPVHKTVGDVAERCIVSRLERGAAGPRRPEAVDRARRHPRHDRRVGGKDRERRAEAVTGDEQRQSRGLAA